MSNLHLLALVAAANVDTTVCQLPSIPLQNLGVFFAMDCLAPPEGEVVNARATLSYANGPGDDAADIMVSVQAPSKGLPFWTITGADLGWSGVGRFAADVETDVLNGPFDVGDPPGDFSLILVTLQMVGGGVMEGQFSASAIGVDIRLPRECPWDCGDGNGVVDTVDFLALLSEWGLIGTPCDFDGNGVDTVDFLALLSAWGPC